MPEIMDSPATEIPTTRNTPTAATAITIFATALVIAGVLIILSLLRPSPSIESVREISQVVPIAGAKKYGTRGFMVPLPPPSDEVSALVSDGWTLDLPDNNERPVQCRHKVVVNGVILAAHSNHVQIAESLQGACSVWGSGPGATVRLSLPGATERIESMSVQWHLSRKFGVVTTEQEEQRRSRLSLAGMSMCGIGAAGLALFQRTIRKNWATWILTVAAGSAIGLAAGSWLLGPMDTSVGLWLSTFVSQGILVICLALLVFGLVLAAFARWLKPFVGVPAPALAIVALTVGVSMASLASGWVSNRLPTSPYSTEGPQSVLLAGRIPFSDAAGWYAGMSAVNNGQPVQWAARRPVHALIRSGEFQLAGGNYQWSLLIQAAIFSLAVSALTIAAWSTITPSVALIIWVGIFRVGQGFLGSYLTEAVGYSCACLSLAYLLAGCKHNRFGVRLAGIAWLGMAWLTRPGPLGLLAVPMVLEAIAPAAHRFRRMAIAVAVLASVLLGGKAMFQLVSTDGATENANAAPTIYGLAIGKRWDEAYKDFYAVSPERAKLGLQERTSLMYQEAWTKFSENPMLAINKSVAELRNGFQNSLILLPGRLWTSLIASTAPWRISDKLVGWILFVGGTITVIIMLKRKNLIGTLLSSSVIGMIVSLPIIWGDGGLRGVIIATPSLIVFLSLIWTIPEGIYGSETSLEPKENLVRLSHACGTVILTMFIIGIAAYITRKSPTLATATPMTISIGKDPTVFISDTHSSANINGAALLTKADAIQSIIDRGMAVYKLDEFIQTISPSSLIALKFNSETSSQMLVVENPGDPRDGQLQVDSTAPTKNPYFIKATKWHWIEK